MNRIFVARGTFFVAGARRAEVDGAHAPSLEDPVAFAALWKQFVRG